MYCTDVKNKLVKLFCPIILADIAVQKEKFAKMAKNESWPIKSVLVSQSGNSLLGKVWQFSKVRNVQKA